jgi:hypothetical protein
MRNALTAQVLAFKSGYCDIEIFHAIVEFASVAATILLPTFGRLFHLTYVFNKQLF